MTIAAPPIEESEVVRLAQAGDRSAFDHLYELYLPKIFDYTLSMLRNRADAEDATSETFLVAVERMGDVRDPAAFKGWLYTIARNAALKIVDSRKRMTPTDDYTDDAAAYAAAPLPVGEERAEFTEMRELFDQAASTLSEKERTVYELAVRHNMSSAEIGKVLGVRPAYAYILVNRLKTSMSEAAEAVLLARVGAERCPELARVLQGVDPVSSRGRKAVARHARTCDICEDTKRRRASLPVLMQGVAYAEPGHHFRRQMREKIDAKWSGAGTGAAVTAGTTALVSGIVAVLVVTGSLVAGAAQRTIARHEPVRPAVTESTPAPSAAPTPVIEEVPADDGGPVFEDPALEPQAPIGGDPQVVVVGGGNEGVTTGTESSSNSSSTETGSHEDPPCCDQPPSEGGHQQDPPPVG